MAPTWVRQCFWGLAFGGGLYVVSLLALTIPTLQRNATYAHNINPARWQNLTNVEQFGFVHHQVQPFTFKSSENVTLYAWHILPTHLYRESKEQLTVQSDFGVKSFPEALNTAGMRLLFEDPNASLVVSFHGNAAHIGSSHRPATYQQILSISTPERPVHLIAFDYRGFGWSTGTPSEQGVINDGVSLLSALCGTPSGLPEYNGDVSLAAPTLKPAQIILVGQSLGTFISTATLHEWTIKLGQAPCKALLLLASFSSLAKLLESYSIKGLTPPLLSPLTQYPFLQKWFLHMLIDKWDTASRLKDLLQQKHTRIDVTMMHAKDDWEIPYREGYRNWLAVVEAANATGSFTSTAEDYTLPEFTKTWTSEDGLKNVRWDKIRHGGHNKIPTGEHVKLALYDILDRA